jgi:hypothetical protein
MSTDLSANRFSLLSSVFTFLNSYLEN